MYVITVEFLVRSGYEEAFIGRVQTQAADSLERETDCLRFDVCRDPKAPERIFLYEIYRDENAFQQHLVTPHFQSFDSDVQAWTAAKTVRAWQLISQGEQER